MSQEEIKILQKYEQDVLNTPIFQHRDDGEVVLEGNQDKNNQLKSVIDTNMLIGRNHSIQDIVTFLKDEDKTSRLLHVYGSDGHGKSDIANYSGKYALYGRVDLDGALYVEAEDKGTINGLIQRIGKRLSEKTVMPQGNGEYTKEHIISIIHERKYLVIIDKCKKLLKEAKDQFNRFLGNLVNRTLKTKFIIITTQEEDITEDYIHKIKKLEIPELSVLDAAKLLMSSGKESKYLKGFKDEYELSKHKIFQVLPKKP